MAVAFPVRGLYHQICTGEPATLLISSVMVRPVGIYAHSDEPSGIRAAVT